MNREPASRRSAACGWALLSLALTGCGGSHSTAPVSPPAANTPAIITQTNGDSANYGYTINLLPSGAATYTRQMLTLPPSSPGVASGPVQTGTVPMTLAGQFFKDLSAAVPMSNLPEYEGVRSGGASLTVTYQGQTGPIDNPNDAREATLAADASAIAKALGIPQV